MKFENLPIILNSQNITIGELIKSYPINGDHVISQLLRYLKEASKELDAWIAHGPIRIPEELTLDPIQVDYFFADTDQYMDIPHFTD